MPLTLGNSEQGKSQKFAKDLEGEGHSKKLTFFVSTCNKKH